MPFLSRSLSPLWSLLNRSPVAEFIDPWPDWGIILTPAKGCRTGTLMAGGPVRQPYAGVDFIPQSGIYEFGYCSRSHRYTVCGTTNRAPHWSWLSTLFPRNLCKIWAISVQSYLQPTPAPSTCEGCVYANLKQFAHVSGVGHKLKCSFSHFREFFLRQFL